VVVTACCIKWAGVLFSLQNSLQAGKRKAANLVSLYWSVCRTLAPVFSDDCSNFRNFHVNLGTVSHSTIASIPNTCCCVWYYWHIRYPKIPRSEYIFCISTSQSLLCENNFKNNRFIGARNEDLSQCSTILWYEDLFWHERRNKKLLFQCVLTTAKKNIKQNLKLNLHLYSLIKKSCYN